MLNLISNILGSLPSGFSLSKTFKDFRGGPGELISYKFNPIGNDGTEYEVTVKKVSK